MIPDSLSSLVFRSFLWICRCCCCMFADALVRKDITRQSIINGLQWDVIRTDWKICTLWKMYMLTSLVTSSFHILTKDTFDVMHFKMVKSEHLKNSHKSFEPMFCVALCFDLARILQNVGLWLLPFHLHTEWKVNTFILSKRNTKNQKFALLSIYIKNTNRAECVPSRVKCNAHSNQKNRTLTSWWEKPTNKF